jgi:hypothetical protein
MRRVLRSEREARADRVIVRELRWQHLDGHGPVQAPVSRAIDDGHPAAADLGVELIVLANGGEDAVMQRVGHDRFLRR